jgi:hypothetical protein
MKNQVRCFFLLISCLVVLIFDPEDGRTNFLPSTGNFYQTTLYHIPEDCILQLEGHFAFEKKLYYRKENEWFVPLQDFSVSDLFPVSRGKKFMLGRCPTLSIFSVSRPSSGTYCACNRNGCLQGACVFRHIPGPGACKTIPLHSFVQELSEVTAYRSTKTSINQLKRLLTSYRKTRMLR